MLAIDGSQGEGGGQVLRTSLALSAITGQPFSVTRIRAGRSRPGLLRQHLTGVRAVAEVCGAEVDGAELGSQQLVFRPGPIRGGEREFAIGSAGSAGLVLQALLPVLLHADGPSVVRITGGTHNPASPPAPFLEGCLLPLLRRMGLHVELTVEACGFYPAGGGAYRARVTPSRPTPLALMDRGELRAVRAVALSANLPRHVGVREVARLRERLDLPEDAARAMSTGGPGPGNAAWVEAETDALTEVFTAFGERGVPAEAVADRAADEFVAWRDRGAPVGEHLADQLLVFLALAGEGRFRTGPPSAHTTTNADVIRRFLGRGFRFAPDGGTIVAEVA